MLVAGLAGSESGSEGVWLASQKEDGGIYTTGLPNYTSLSLTALIDSPDGQRLNWRADLAKQLFNLQKEDGSWSNENGRWMEKDSVLSTAYAVLALEHIIRRL